MKIMLRLLKNIVEETDTKTGRAFDIVIQFLIIISGSSGY
jgi:hypothetical protein